MKAAVAAFEQALVLEPGNASALWNLSDVLHAQKRDLDRSDVLLLRALETGLPEGLDYTVGRTVAYTRGGEAGRRGLRLLDRALAAKPEEPRLRLLRGRYRQHRHQCEKPRRLRERRPASIPATPSPTAPWGSPASASATAKVPARAFRRAAARSDQPEIRRALGQIGPS